MRRARMEPADIGYVNANGSGTSSADASVAATRKWRGMRIQGIDHVEWYVSDLKGTAGKLCRDFGFRIADQHDPAPADPGSAAPEQAPEPDAGRGDLLEALDHIAVCLPAGQLDATVRFYRDAFGLTQVFDERIEANGQAMLSKVVQNEARSVTFTLIEPDATLDPGQIDQFLRAHGGAGVQHLAFGTSDIAQAVGALAHRGVGFLAAPPGYYRTLETRLGTLAIPVSELEKLNVLADTDRWGQLFQIFTRSEALGGEQESLTATI